MASPSDAVVLLAYTFFSFEFLTDIFVLAIACLNLAVIGPTKLLHPNLKFILITQSVAVVLFLLVRSAMLVLKFISTDDLFTPANLILQIIIIIGRYNQRKYDSQIEEASPNNYHIGQRYQVSENVKTAKQLLPAFFCIFLSNLVTALLYSIIAFNLVNESYQISLAFAFFTWSDTMLGAAIELTVITHHPLLKKHFVRILNNIFCFKRNQVGVAPNCTELAAIGRNGENEGTGHFEMLQQLWNK
uniref:G protein-coupled receptor n=1 Tax=Globodera rostochiensis TaxID=31243 RepID=A0A914HAI5_GLORO